MNENLVNKLSSSLPNRMDTSSRKLTLSTDIRNLAMFWCLCCEYICSHLVIKKIINELTKMFG